MTDIEFYKQLEDYDLIKEYLDNLNTDDFSPPTVPPFKPDFSTAIIADNLPVVAREKSTKLLQVLYKIFCQTGCTEADMCMPFNEETQMTYGFCSIKYPNKEMALSAIAATDGVTLDKRHPLKVSLYSDIDKYSSISDEYIPNQVGEFRPRPDPTLWLTDPQCRDMFVVRCGQETEISWSNHTGEEPTLVYAGEREKVGGKVWCESYVKWSPQGTYLATFHPLGIKIWGSDQFEAMGRFLHTEVEIMDFSPCESYIVTYRYAQNSNHNAAEAIIVWDVRTGAKIRCLPLKNPLDTDFQVQAMVVTEDKAGKKTERLVRGRVKAYEGNHDGGTFTILEGNVTHTGVPLDQVTAVQEPNRLKWSADGKYLARLGCDIIQVYELPFMQLLDKKSIAAKDVLDFTWSPRSNMISYWSPAVGNHPALINIIKLPERLDICSRKLFDVSDGRMVWQNDGDYLCVYMTKISGKKKAYVLMFFRVLEAEVPVEQLELPDPILSVTWEPSGDRVTIVHGESRTPTVSFYSMYGVSTKAGKGRKEFTHLFSLTGVQCNNVIWSPAGGVVALTYYAPDSCVFELHDVENNVSLATRKHDRGNKLMWDPTGRYIASCTLTPLRNAAARAQADDGFNLYTFQGTPLCQVKRQKVFQFDWRPRPKDLLLPEEKKKIIKNLKKYEKIFDKEDRHRKQELHAEVQAMRHRLASEFLSRLSQNTAETALLKQKRVEIRNGYDSDDDRNYNVNVQVRHHTHAISSKMPVFSFSFCTTYELWHLI
jgi:translation initiation factor 3 subunit B